MNQEQGVETDFRRRVALHCFVVGVQMRVIVDLQRRGLEGFCDLVDWSLGCSMGLT